MLRQELDKLKASCPRPSQPASSPRTSSSRSTRSTASAPPRTPPGRTHRRRHRLGAHPHRALVHDSRQTSRQLHLLRERWIPPRREHRPRHDPRRQPQGHHLDPRRQELQPQTTNSTKCSTRSGCSRRHPEITGGRPVIGVIVHRKHKLYTPRSQPSTTTSCAAPRSASPTCCSQSASPAPAANGDPPGSLNQPRLTPPAHRPPSRARKHGLNTKKLGENVIPAELTRHR